MTKEPATMRYLKSLALLKTFEDCQNIDKICFVPDGISRSPPPARIRNAQGGARYSLSGIEDYPWLKELNIEYWDRGSIYGIEYCPELEKVSIRMENLGRIDLAPLCHLGSLKSLILYQVDLTDVVLNIPSLTSLLLEGCSGMTDFQFLRGVQLIELFCRDGGVKSLRGLDVSRLVKLNLGGNALVSVEELAEASSLRKLSLCNNSIISLKPLEALVAQGTLKMLKIYSESTSNNPVTDLVIDRTFSLSCYSDGEYSDVTYHLDFAQDGDSSDDFEPYYDVRDDCSDYCSEGSDGESDHSE